jgi:putative nucleotidyltransferase with HDIG domain
LNSFNEEKAVARLAEIVALECGATPAEARKIRAAAAIHDIGKQKIPAEILNKPGKLTAPEFEIVKTHTTLGAAMLSSIQGEIGAMARLIAEFHHEHYDGHGYWGKSLYEFPYYLQFVSIADVFTALVSERPYKERWPPRDALEYIRNQSGAMFNPLLVDVFIPLIENDSRARAIFEEG